MAPPILGICSFLLSISKEVANFRTGTDEL